MSVIKEDYVSFEVAKLLKEKGFEVEIDTYYSPEGKFKMWCPNGLKSYLNNDNIETWWCRCIAPTQSMVMKWLRDVHNLYCSITYDFELDWCCKVVSLKKTTYNHIDDCDEAEEYDPPFDNGFSSYESAVEDAIKYCLEKLI